MIPQDYLEVAKELQGIVWDIEDANELHIDFSEIRFEKLKKLYHRCEIFMVEFENYKKLRGIE
jgi:hypothetical protein